MTTASLLDDSVSDNTELESQLSSMTKAQLQAYATENGIAGVDSARQNKAEMIAAILGA